MIPHLSVIVPAYNEARRLPDCLYRLHRYLEHQPYRYEIIVVNNGSSDATAEICARHAQVYNHFRWASTDQRGKGLAVRIGMLAAEGKFRYMCDCDLSTPPEEIGRFLEMALQYDVVIGSREIVREIVTTKLTRRITGRVLHALVSDLAPNVQDTQCGFKMFRDYAAMALFSQMTINSVAFDVEAIYLARLLAYTLKELPVQWTHDNDSRMGLRDGLAFAWDVLNIPLNHLKIKLPA